MAKEIQPLEATRDTNELALAIRRADALLGRTYLSVLGGAEVAESPYQVVDNAAYAEELNEHVRLYNISKLVLDKSENMRDKLATVFQAVHAVGASFILLVTGKKESVSIHAGVRFDGDEDGDGIDLAQDVLSSSLDANFPGIVTEKADEKALGSLASEAFAGKPRVATVSDVPGLRFEDETRERRFMQGIEKLIDAMQGKEYSFLVIADPVSANDLAISRRAMENLYSNLVPFGESQFTAGTSETDSISRSLTKGVTTSINKSVSDSIAHTTGESSTTTDGTNTTKNYGAAAGLVGSVAGAATGATIGTALFPGVGTAIGSVIGGGITALGGSIGNAIGGALIGSKGKSHSESRSTNKSEAKTHTETRGTSESDSESSTDGESMAVGKTQSFQIKFENHTVTQLLDRIKRTLKRYDECGDLGMWNCAAYCLSDKPPVAQMGASLYHALVRGEDSSLESGGVIMWDKERSAKLLPFLRHMEHPCIIVKDDGLMVRSVTPGTLVSSAELAIGAGLPNRSIPGVPVLECAEFGRTVSSYNREVKSQTIELGTIFNMNKPEALPVRLDVECLASHVFVTGSTGSGKSNTVYVMLDRLLRKEVKFLVVEPAKGEYRHVFGGRPSVAVYGTNPTVAPLLRINPFSFPHGNDDPAKNIHILEHLDRLVEIFNVCWPMYAAMPAVLKEAIERSYEDCGWNLAESSNRHEEEGWQNLYPTFADVTRNIRRIIDSSEYDAENKGAYKGSLITRLKSLTNGINGLVFTADEISGEELFDENVIVDLSRVGSAETKSLIMGLLVLKLQEHRMTKGGMNAKLQHVTVLEEAHNLLKRTSTEQSQDSGNLLGKSVEMLANSIAEMRTYGEGFIIADQAPGLLDMAVIRNTNTKIVMRLPDQGDRELVGKAMHLNDDQIAELAKLPRGVAAVYQNEWVESVLCKVEHYGGEKEQRRKPTDWNKVALRPLTPTERLEIARLMFSGERPSKSLLDDLKEARVRMSARSRIIVAQRLKDHRVNPQFTKAGAVVAEVFPESSSALRRAIETTTSKARWTEELNAAVTAIEGLDSAQLRKDIDQAIITEVLLSEMGKKDDFDTWHRGGFLK